MASKGQKFSSYSLEFKNEVLKAYKSGKYGGRNQMAKHYGISKEDWKERYEILKKYQVFVKA